MLVFLALGKAKEKYFALGDAKVPNANVFAFWWNIGYSIFNIHNFKAQKFKLVTPLFYFISEVPIFQSIGESVFRRISVF